MNGDELELFELYGWGKDSIKDGKKLVETLINKSTTRREVLDGIMASPFDTDQRMYLCYYYGAIEMRMAIQELARIQAQEDRKKRATQDIVMPSKKIVIAS